MTFDVGNGRPNDQRGFIHGKILGVVGAVVSTVGRVASFIPGSEFLRTGGAAASRLGAQIRGSAFQPQAVSLVPSVIGITPQQRITARLPESGPMQQNRSVGIVPQDRFQNGLCPTDEPRVCPPRGFHVNKSAYFLRDGTFVAAGSRFVRNRRLNNANGRAQDKAIVRLEKGQDHAKKLLKATGWRTISKQSSKEMRNARKAACK